MAAPGAGLAGKAQRLEIQYAKNTLTIRHFDDGGPTTHVCTRA